MKKGSKIYSIVHQTCPRCQNDQMFDSANPYNLPKLMKMKDKCALCGYVYEMEPSFFYGAMYVNYAITVAISVSIFVAMYVLGTELEMKHYLIGIIGGLFLSAPLTYRLGRMIWINMFVSYKREHDKA